MNTVQLKDGISKWNKKAKPLAADKKINIRNLFKDKIVDRVKLKEE
jgi:hypothetical protein